MTIEIKDCTTPEYCEGTHFWSVETSLDPIVITTYRCLRRYGGVPLDEEVWRLYPTNPRYSVSNFGRVKHTKKDTIVEPQFSESKGQVFVISIWSSERKRSVHHTVHRMVAETFFTDFDPATRYGHKTLLKADNHMDNIRPVRYYKVYESTTRRVFNNAGEAARYFGLHPVAVHKVIKGKRPHTHGYKFKAILKNHKATTLL